MVMTVNETDSTEQAYSQSRHEGMKKSLASEACKLTLGKLTIMVAVMDELKNVKSSGKKTARPVGEAARLLKMITEGQAIRENQSLPMVPAKQASVRKALEEIKNSDDPACDLLNICRLRYEQRTYLSAAEEHTLVKITISGRFLFDNGTRTMTELGQGNKIELAKLDKKIEPHEPPGDPALQGRKDLLQGIGVVMPLRYGKANQSPIELWIRIKVKGFDDNSPKTSSLRPPGHSTRSRGLWKCPVWPPPGSPRKTSSSAWTPPARSAPRRATGSTRVSPSPPTPRTAGTSSRR